jgi:hypothetical protein
VESARPDGELDERRLITECPYFGEKAVGIIVDTAQVRLVHHCRSCARDLPLHMTDEEIYRYQPAVLISTVDKLTGYSFFGEYTTFSHSPRYWCPDHGYFSLRVGGRCLVGRELCQRSGREYTNVATRKDPVPALVVQDEMHLLKEELGVFDAHYEGMLAELQRAVVRGLPSKILAASATIEQYEDQLRQVYGRRPRSFPTPGWNRELSFYTATTSGVRRMYLGVLPHYRRKADVAAIVQTELIRAIATLQDVPDAASRIGLPGLSGTVMDELLFNAEVSLGYVDSKAAGALIAEQVGRLSEFFENTDRDAIALRVLTGEVGGGADPGRARRRGRRARPL